LGTGPCEADALRPYGTRLSSMPAFSARSFQKALRDTWFFNVRAHVLAGIVVALALIPEAIAFSVIAGVDPQVGLYAAFPSHGLEYLLAATLLTGVLQVLAGVFRLGGLMRFVSRSVVTGFVNALAILIFLAQLPEITRENARLMVFAILAVGLIIIYGLPRLTKSIPSPLVCIVVLTAAAILLGLDVRVVGGGSRPWWPGSWWCSPTTLPWALWWGYF